jgi:simple sugar transport system ATP-binding protein
VVSDVLLEMRGIVKHYGTVKANDGVDLSVRTGSVTALLGENGSGKSTLMKILLGLVPCDGGSISFEGNMLGRHSPGAARTLGIGMIHQHFMLAEALSVLENVRLVTDASADEVRRISSLYGLAVDPNACVSQLSLGERQRVEIMKALLAGAKLLVLDEPTSNLSPPEVEGLFAVIARLRSEGKTTIFISHKLTEVLALCDDFIVLRDGRAVGAGAIADTNQNALATMMVGREVGIAYERTTHAAGEVRLELSDVSVPGDAATVPLTDIDLIVRAGEVVAIAGVDGNGQRELAEAIAGMRRCKRGRILVDGVDMTHSLMRQRVSAGVAYIPADRKTTSLVPALSVAENLVLRDVDRFSRRGWMNRVKIRALAQQTLQRFDIKAASIHSPVKRLSGGNQQKIVIARELDRVPKVLVAMQATWGLDPRTSQFVLEQILRLRDAGAAILYISSELEEVLRLGDRIGFLFQGRLTPPVARQELEIAQIGLKMSGIAA